MTSCERVKIGDYEANNVIIPVGDDLGPLEFVFTFCPRGLSRDDHVDLLARGALASCEIDCEHFTGCQRDPKYPDWRWVLEKKVAAPYELEG